MNTIWSEEELNRINIIIRKFNLKIMNDGTISNDYNNTKYNDNYYVDDFVKEKIKELYILQDEEEINNILKKIIPIKYTVKSNQNSALCFGMLTNLSNINPKDKSEIFNIFLEILFQYSRITTRVADILINTLKEPDIIYEEIEKIKNSQEETKYEKIIIDRVTKILNCTFGINESYLFKEIIEYYKTNVKINLIKNLDFRLGKEKYLIERSKNKIINDYTFEKASKSIREKTKKAQYFHR